MPLSDSEHQRLETLHAFDVVESAQEKLFDDITELTAYLFNVPVARIAFVAGEQVWHMASAGMAAGDPLSPEQSICSRAVRRPEPVLVYEDLRQADEPAPALMQERNVVFYAGALLSSSSGHALGTLCVAGSEPRTFSPDEQEVLLCIARLVVVALERRRQLRATQGMAAWERVRANVEASLAQQMVLVRYLKARTPDAVPVPKEVLDLVCSRLEDVMKVVNQ